MFDAKCSGTTATNTRVGEIWAAYKQAEFKRLRTKTQENYTNQWTFFETFVGALFIAENLTHAQLDELRDALREVRSKKLSVRIVRDIFATVRRVYCWAEGREMITKNRAESYRYKVAKSERTASRDEYTPAERGALLGTLNPMLSLEWRAYVALTICGHQGARQNAVLHLQWVDRCHLACAVGQKR